MAKELEVPHDPYFAQLWGENYREHPDFQAEVMEKLEAGRALWQIKLDLRDSNALS